MMSQQDHVNLVQTGCEHRHHRNPAQAIIGGEDMDEEVHDFVSKHTTGLSQRNIIG
jgi:hypothetical protein